MEIHDVKFWKKKFIYFFKTVSDILVKLYRFELSTIRHVLQ